MQTNFRGRDFIGDLDFTNEEVETVLDVAWDLKRKRALGEPHAYLRDKVLAMLFFFSSTRTRGSFEAGIAQLGGHGAFIDSNTTQISHGDTPVEIGEIFGRYFDGIAIRHCDFGDGNKYLNDVAKNSRAPVLNMQSDIYHPFELDLVDLGADRVADFIVEAEVELCGDAPGFPELLDVFQALAADLVPDGQHTTRQRPARFIPPHDAARKATPRLEDVIVDAA